jgi:flagellar basal-body rod modification protein FlgD
MQPQAASTGAASGSTGTSSSSGGSNGLSAGDLQSTFLNLLVTELQNQDPTQPVDPTEMVSQMVSLNQLDQLISINQTLANMSGGTGASGSAGASSQAQGVTGALAASPAVNGTATGSSNPAAVQFQPAYTGVPTPGALMNLYGNIGVPATSSTLSTPGGR